MNVFRLHVRSIIGHLVADIENVEEKPWLNTAIMSHVRYWLKTFEQVTLDDDSTRVVEEEIEHLFQGEDHA